MASSCPRLFDYFLSVGTERRNRPLLPDEVPSPFQPAMLDRYPRVNHSDFELPQNAEVFCMPEGCLIISEKEFANPLDQDVFSFVLTGADGSRTYGTSLCFFEPVEAALRQDALQYYQQCWEDSCDYDGSECSSLRSSLASPKESSAKKVELTVSNGEEPLLYSLRSICLLSHWPFLRLHRRLLLFLFNTVKEHGVSPLPVERYIDYFVSQLPLPPPGMVPVEFELNQERFKYQRPYADSLPLLDYHFEILFRCLDTNNLLNLFTCILLEKRIVLYSADFSVLTPICEALTSLLFPICWQHVYVPVLPQALLQYVIAPVPFIMGVHKSCVISGLQALAASEGEPIVLVDIDLNLVAVTDVIPDLPEPAASELRSRLNTELPMRRRGTVEVPFVFQVKETNQNSPLKRESIEDGFWNGRIKTVREGFLRFFLRLFRNYRSYMKPTKGIKGLFQRNSELKEGQLFNFDRFIHDSPDQARPFFKAFLKTQMFSTFVQDACNSVDDPEISFFDRCAMHFEKGDLDRYLLQKSYPVTGFIEIIHPPPLEVHESVQPITYSSFPRVLSLAVERPRRSITVELSLEDSKISKRLRSQSIEVGHVSVQIGLRRASNLGLSQAITKKLHQHLQARSGTRQRMMSRGSIEEVFEEGEEDESEAGSRRTSNARKSFTVIEEEDSKQRRRRSSEKNRRKSLELPPLTVSTSPKLLPVNCSLAEVESAAESDTESDATSVEGSGVDSVYEPPGRLESQSSILVNGVLPDNLRHCTVEKKESSETLQSDADEQSLMEFVIKNLDTGEVLSLYDVDKIVDPALLSTAKRLHPS
eukprot:GILJ01007564.1.p1 GENE.GILJ01007564.1~~GILJ01007564.1.p1  ORF type:complete len:818 (+),score=135.80 GILJ01007564.1:88-2541(+)